MKINQNTQEVKNERFLIFTIQNNVRIFGILAFGKATKQTDIKHEMGKRFRLMSLLKIVGEKLPPSQRSSLENVYDYDFYQNYFVICW